MNKILSNPITIIFFTLFVIVAFISLRKNAAKTQISAQNIAILEKEIISLEEQIDKSNQTLEENQQPLTKEKILRNELLMQKEGEYILQLPNLEKSEDSAIQQPTTPWDEWKQVFGF